MDCSTIFYLKSKVHGPTMRKLSEVKVNIIFLFAVSTQMPSHSCSLLNLERSLDSEHIVQSREFEK